MLERPRVILLISPQPWNASKVSKHHYARELAIRGHTIYFIEPPGPMTRRPPRIVQGPYDTLFIVTYGTFFPYRLKFYARSIFEKLMRHQARLLLTAIGREPDIVWDFDNAYQYNDLRAFGSTFKVFHPVDNLPIGTATSKHADVVFSNAQRYIDRLKPPPRIARVIDHGLSEEFIAYARSVAEDPTAGGKCYTNKGDTPLIAYVGNLDRPGIDWATIEAAAKNAPGARIMMIGPYGRYGRGPPTSAFTCDNIEFTGPKTADEILDIAHNVDVWLMAYDRHRDVDGGTNPHKLLEYLATGKIVVSNWAEAYAENDLLVMPPTPDNAPLPALVADTLANLDKLNAPANRARRAAYTLGFSYAAHLKAIDATMDASRSAC
ncbi:MAG: hypothetical protein AAGB04_01900 [Pseudomonadota bacterium]